MCSLKAIVLLTLLLITHSVITSGQTKAAKCPEVSVEVPDIPLRKGEKTTFTASVKGVDARVLKFHWDISTGKILGGQGTTKIQVVYTRPGYSLTATVEVKGLPKGCMSSASATSPIWDPPYAMKMEEYGPLSWNDEKFTLKALVPEITKAWRPGSSVYFLISIAPNETFGNTRTRIREVISFFRSEIGDRVIQFHFLVEKADEHITKVFLVPPRADPPICGKGCKTINAKGVLR